MSLVTSLGTLTRVLETYRGKDRFIRLTSYIGMFLGGDGKTPAQLKWRIVSAELGACRTILRLFDDIPMLLYNISIGFGLKEKGVLLPLELLISLLNQSYYPIEHLAWLRQKKVLGGTGALLSLLGVANWTLSLLGEIIKSLIKLNRLSTQARRLHKQQELDKDGSDSESSQNVEIKENLKKLSADRRDLMLLLLQYCADFTNAVSWLPPGILWAQKLRPSTNGILGIVATLIMLYRNWPSSVKT
uniref:Peroxisomal membrane protein 11C n=1 Tax=Arion vulgaris TaxID=1028688 RepID=A0A0B7BN94_9EUPU